MNKSVRNIALVSSLLLISYFGNSQVGYLGKTHSLSVTGIANIPLFSGAFNDTTYYVRSSNKLVEGRDWFDYGANLYYCKVFNSKLSFGVKLGLKQFEVFPDRKISSSFISYILGKQIQTALLHSESTRIHRYSVLPTVSLSAKGSQAGAGVHHEISFGYSLSRLINSQYRYSVSYSGQEEDLSEVDVFIRERESPMYHGIILGYGLYLQVPITDKIHFKTGSYNTMSLIFIPNLTDEEIMDGYLNYKDIQKNIQRESLLNWHLEFGFCYTF